jgi:hypothetical protein
VESKRRKRRCRHVVQQRRRRGHFSTKEDHVQTATEWDVRTTEEPPPWRFCTRVAFRFCFVYLGLFCLTFAQITFAFAGALARWLPEHAMLWQMMLLDAVTRWVGRTVFGADAALNPDSGSGDQSSIWVLVFCLLLVALVATAVWSALDRHRLTYRRLAAGFLVFLRMCLGGQMLFYGFAKVIPTQMPAPPLAALLERFGAVTTDESRWQRVVFDAPELVTCQRMNGDLVDVAAIRSDDTLTLSDVATFTVDRQAADRLRLTGRLEGRPVSISLHASPWTTSLCATVASAGCRNRRSSAEPRQSGSWTTGRNWAISPAREPDDWTAPPATASGSVSRPVASRSQVRGSVSTTLGGFPRVCARPEMHCTATNGGTRTSTLAPGANAASVLAVSRTASAMALRSGAAAVSSRSQFARADTASRVFVGSAVRRAAIP